MKTLLFLAWAAASLVPSSGQPADRAPLTLVETAPVETTLDHPDVPDAWEVWPAMIEGANESLEFAGFYFSNREGSRLETTLRAIEAAAGRRIRVRVLAEAGFHKTYPNTLERLGRNRGIEVRLVDFRKLAGGPMHAKYFLVDGREAFVGSQNFDWRALEHIHETGARIRVAEYVYELQRVFEMDWREGTVLGTPSSGRGKGPRPYRPRGGSPPFRWVEATGDTAYLWPAFSPLDRIPQERDWDLPKIIETLDAARDSIHLTGLSYSPVGRDGTYWGIVDEALRRAAVRGVRVRILLSDWSKREPKIDFLKSLQLVPGIEVRLATIPEAKVGFIPFARVTHSKYLTVDGNRCWLGTSNWEKSYFLSSRNVGFLAHSRRVTQALDRDFATLWNSRYAYPVRPEVIYEPPRIQD